ncbi:MAG TPA: hypothetical protein VIE89_22885 [Candidatus Binatia bacterium]|jgi:hypothetical protein
MQIAVMPAWMAGIQLRKDASENVHVNLDSSAPCWNDQAKGSALSGRAFSAPIFKGGQQLPV